MDGHSKPLLISTSLIHGKLPHLLCFHLSVQEPENSGPRLQNSYPPPAPARPNSWLTIQLLEQDSVVPGLGHELASLAGEWEEEVGEGGM